MSNDDIDPGVYRLNLNGQIVNILGFADQEAKLKINV